MHKTKPLVTIITITFNLKKNGREKYFRQCVESVHSQTYKNIEHIIIDGASTDGTVDLIKEYADKGWIKYISEPDNGVYYAMNKGIKLAKGKYIAFLNSDDFYSSKKGIEISVKMLEESQGDYSYAPALILSPDNKKVNKHPHAIPNLDTAFIEMPFCHQTMLTRKNIIINEGLFNTGYKSAGDYDFVLNIILKGYKGVYVDFLFVTYRLGGLSGNEDSIQAAREEVTQIFYKYYNEFYPISLFECREIQRTHILPVGLANKLSEIVGWGVAKRRQKMIYKPKPRVTIVTITFNLRKVGRKEYFRQCLESVHSQTYEDIEHIIIDGASTDGTIDLIKEYADKGWIKYISEPDKGMYDAMNKGIEMAKGKYIAFLNSDDFYNSKSAVELSINALEATKSDYSFADTQGIDSAIDKLVDIWHGNINLIPFGRHYCHQSMFIKKDILKELGGFDISYKVSADSDLMIKLVVLGKEYIYLPEVIVSYRSGGVSNQHILQTRKDHSKAFYKHIGKNMGLTLDDCFSIWNFSLFEERNIFYCLRVGEKLKREEWKKEFSLHLHQPGIVRKQIKVFTPKILHKPLSNLDYLIRSKKR